MTVVGHVFEESDFQQDLEYATTLLLKQLNAYHKGAIGLTYNLLQACSWFAKAAGPGKDNDPAPALKVADFRRRLLKHWCEPTPGTCAGNIDILECEERYLAPKVDLRWAEVSNTSDGMRLREVRKAIDHWKWALESREVAK